MKPLFLIAIILLCILNSCRKEEMPVVSTSPVTNITTTDATGGGEIISDGGSEIIEKGVCWSVNPDPTTSDLKTNEGKGSSQFTSHLTGLNGGATYHARAYATNSSGTAYGSDVVFTTLGQAPVAATLPVCCITTSGATLNGTVNSNDLSTTVSFEFGTTTAYGNSAEASPGSVTGNISTSVSAGISDLNFGTVYHYRIKAVNALGTTYGDDLSFTTLSHPPSATTQPACYPTATGIQLNGIVIANYLSTTVSFEYGLTDAYDSSVSAIQNPVTGNNPEGVTAVLSGLMSGTTYHYRIKAENAHGTSYGNDMSFTTQVIDRDQNIYKIVTIGTQVWMAENLKTTKYSNGDQIPYEPNGTEWNSLSTGAYTWYNNNSGINQSTYGALYNWFSVQDARNLCPTGWHVPSNADWATLTTYLGGESLAGGKLKETGTTHWQSPNTGATNESGFTALAGGGRFYEISGGIVVFYGFGSYGYWWSSTAYSSSLAWYFTMAYNNDNADRSNDLKTDGISVRCLKND